MQPLVAGARLRWARDITGRPPSDVSVKQHEEDCALLVRLGWTMDDVTYVARRVAPDGTTWTVAADVEEQYHVSSKRGDVARHDQATSFAAALALTPWPGDGVDAAISSRACLVALFDFHGINLLAVEVWAHAPWEDASRARLGVHGRVHALVVLEVLVDPRLETANQFAEARRRLFRRMALTPRDMKPWIAQLDAATRAEYEHAACSAEAEIVEATRIAGANERI